MNLPHISRPSGERRHEWQIPPTRKSNLATGIVQPFGPNHCFKRSLSVHAFQTGSRGASNVREMTNGRTALSLMIVVIVPALLGFLRGGGNFCSAPPDAVLK